MPSLPVAFRPEARENYPALDLPTVLLLAVGVAAGVFGLYFLYAAIRFIAAFFGLGVP
ncbi:MAG: hypothetical protein PHP43_02790 [Methanoculleus sp.]|nr:hypothetical protein [Methanoculleus sp.]